MGRIAKYTRRGFLVFAAALAGGTAFVAWKASEIPPNPLAPGEGEAALNPWVLIGPGGVTIVTPRAEMGQGVHTTLAALVAEELDLAWEDVRVIHGPPAQAYYNGAMIEGGLPFPTYAMSGARLRIVEGAWALPKMLSLQITGGSSSMADAYERLRHAGAAAREALKAAAGKRLGLAASELRTERGHAIAPDGSRIPYAELAPEAASAELPDDIPLRNPAEWKLLGRALPRLDMAAKATGTAGFGVDTMLPGMKFATVRMSPRLGAGIARLNADAARAMPGVERIVSLGTGVAVIARTTWHAFQAAQALEIEWEPAPYPETTEAIFAAIAEGFGGWRNSRLRSDGDIPDPAPGDIEAEYRVPFLAHVTMEPMAATALRTETGLEIWAGTQVPVFARDHAAAAIGIAPEAVILHVTYLGGGFGRRLETDFTTLAARVADAMPGVPVKTIWSRAEDMRHDFYRPAAIARFRGRAGAEGIGMLDARIAAPSLIRQWVGRLLMPAEMGPDRTIADGVFDQPYAIANCRVTGYNSDPGVPVGNWRSVGHSHGGFFHESFIDELAHAAGADPLEFRLRHIRPEHAPSSGVLEAVGEMSGWGTNAPGTAKGVAFVHSFGTPVAEVVEVRDEGGLIRVRRAWIACDVGRALDPGIVEAQMVSGLIFGLSAAIMGEITFRDGEVEQQNFPDYDALRISGAPEISVRILETNPRLGGAGEPATPPAAPALANAIFALTGQRIRELPLSKAVAFVL
jgi:isoquinoline 1-oxidoreductase beta subunit